MNKKKYLLSKKMNVQVTNKIDFGYEKLPKF
jgi:hypothetical protein